MVFISFGSCDRKVAEQICNCLESRGIKCWVSFRDITSGNFSGEITRALRNSDIMLVVCSKQACRSEHVKNEVTLAFNQKKHIIPYLLEENSFDDDLEYFLSLKQHILASGNREKDFALIEKFIHDYRGDTAPVAAPAPAAAPAPVATPTAPATKKPSSSKLIVPVVAALLILGGGIAFWMLRKPVANTSPETAVAVKQDTIKPLTETPPQQSTQAGVQQPANEQQPKAQTQQQTTKKETTAAAASSNMDTFTGSVTGGYPDGFGTYTFKSRRRIDMHDPEGRYAEPGDYIKGDWKHGHLNYGEWYDSSGNKKAFIQLGDNPDTGPDQKLGKCVKR